MPFAPWLSTPFSLVVFYIHVLDLVSLAEFASSIRIHAIVGISFNSNICQTSV